MLLLRFIASGCLHLGGLGRKVRKHQLPSWVLSLWIFEQIDLPLDIIARPLIMSTTHPVALFLGVASLTSAVNTSINCAHGSLGAFVQNLFLSLGIPDIWNGFVFGWSLTSLPQRHQDPEYENCICDDGWKTAGITDTLHFLQGACVWEPTDRRSIHIIYIL